MAIDLLVIADEIASGIYEIKNLLDHIRTFESNFTYEVIIDLNISEKVLNNAKCILFFRSRSVLDYEIAKLCKRLNKTIYLFIDDDFLGLEDDYGVYKSGIWSGRKKALIKMLPLVDAIISPNNLLSIKYANYAGIDRRVRIDTAVDEDSLSLDCYPDKSRIVLYINDGSLDMFNKYLKPALLKIGEDYPDFFQIDLLSLKPDCSDIKGVKINFIPHMTYPQFRKYMRETPFFLGIAPLDDNGFNRYKYFNKYIEYTRAGILGIYSDCPLYRQVVRDHINGLLVDNSPDSWVTAIEYCINHEEEHHKYLKEAQKIISSQFNKDYICKRLIADLPEILEDKEGKKAVKFDITVIKSIHYISRFIERTYLLHKYWKVGGINTVINALKQRQAFNKEKNHE